MKIITIEEAQLKLSELIERLTPGEELIITRDHQPVAKLIGQHLPTPRPRWAGSAKGRLVILCEDDEHLDDFKAYMP